MSNILQCFPCLSQLANAPLQSQPCLKALKREWPSAQGKVGCHNAFRFPSWPGSLSVFVRCLTSELREPLFPLLLYPSGATRTPSAHWLETGHLLPFVTEVANLSQAPGRHSRQWQDSAPPQAFGGSCALCLGKVP